MSKNIQSVTITAKVILPAPDRASMRTALDLADSIETAMKLFPGAVVEKYEATVGKRQVGNGEAAQAETPATAEPQVPLGDAATSAAAK